MAGRQRHRVQNGSGDQVPGRGRSPHGRGRSPGAGGGTTAAVANADAGIDRPHRRNGPIVGLRDCILVCPRDNPRTCSVRERRGEPQVAFEGMRQAWLPESVLAIAIEGFRKLRDPLSAAILLLHPLMSAEETTIEDDPFVPETMIGDVPSWA
jgi:hypothetical protein